MTDQPALSTEELEALTGRKKPRAKAPAPEVPSGGTEAFSFGGGPAAQQTTILPALDRINERIARRMRDVIEPFFRAKPKVEAEPAVLRPLRDWQAEQAVFAGLSMYAIKPLKGTMALLVPSDFVSRLVDAYYGGTGASSHGHAKEFTPTEERLLGRLSDNIVTLMAEIWREVAPIQPELRSRESNIAFAAIGSSDDTVAVCRFTIKLPSSGSTGIDMVLPVAALRSVEGAMKAKHGDEGNAKAAEWADKLTSALCDVRIEARTVLARPELTVSELMQLRVGDVIPVSIPAMVPLLVEGRTVAHGSIGEQDGKAALKIERIEPRRLSA